MDRHPRPSAAMRPRFLLGTACLVATIVVISTHSVLRTQETGTPAPPAGYSPVVHGASNEAELALKRIRVPRGLRADLFAAEPLLANPVCFCTDEHGRFYVAETFRIHAGVEDMRDHMDWLNDDLASRTVADRVALYHKYLGAAADNYTREHDRIRLLEDTTGSGKADRSTVFADGFHDIADGIGAGLIARQGKVWYTCIPNLWLFEDDKNTAHAQSRRVLHTGYGVHISFYGHDLHGLRFGPDGKLYFSSGDRGLNVRTEGRTVSNIYSGAVLRCNPDGSELEVVATGLRNPQELAFDQYGNLFTGDNNADHGDKARLVYVVDGGDSGWRGAYQYVENPVWLGPWNAEQLWQTPRDGQAAYIVPPVAHIAAGPAGFTYNPGATMLPARYKEHFFLCDFGGAPVVSGIRSFAVRPKGASFEMIDQHPCIWSVLATDVDFNVDGALYLTDWVHGWEGTGKGRIYKVHDPALEHDVDVQSVKKLLADGFAQRADDELAKLLQHADMRIRQEAQFALAQRGAAAVPTLEHVAQGDAQRLARLHAIWGLGQIGRKTPQALQSLPTLAQDRDAEVRAQAAKVLGNDHVASARPLLVALLRDPEPRVRFFAAQALGKLGPADAETVSAVLQMVRDNNDKDAFLRHAGVMALAAADPSALNSAAADPSSAVRMAVLLVMRRQQNPDIARYLQDAEPRLVLEAARAIHDVPIPQALPQLAALSTRSALPDPLGYRVLNANYRLGQPANARAIADCAARADLSETVRIEALRELADWVHPCGRDRVLGMWRPLPERPAADAAQALRSTLATVLAGPDGVRREGALAAGKLGIRESAPLLLQLLADGSRDAGVRVEMLKALEAMGSDELGKAVELALSDTAPALRLTALRIQARLQPAAALAAITAILAGGSQSERQSAFQILGDMNAIEAERLLCHWLDELRADRVPAEVQLDLLNAAGQSRSPTVRAKLASFESLRSRNSPLAAYRESLRGGDVVAGRKVFYGKIEAACPRCHKIAGDGGDVGPELSGIGSRQTREYILESIVEPNRQIARGYETVVVVLKNGKTFSGILRAEDKQQLQLVSPEGQLIVVAKDDIDERLRGKSAMPDDLMKFLSKSDLRNLVEFLASLKQPPAK